MSKKNKKHKRFFFHRDMPEAIFLEAYLNGKKLEKCAVADVKYGFAIVLVEDENGKAKMDGDDVLFKWVKGKIEIKNTKTGENK